MKKFIAIMLLVMILFVSCGGGDDMAEMDFLCQDNDILLNKVTGARNVPNKPFAMRFEMENKLDDPQRVVFENCTINDYHIDPDYEVTLGPKEKKTVVVEWPEDKFAYNGVEVGGVKEVNIMTESYEAKEDGQLLFGWSNRITIDDSKPWTYTDIEGLPMVLEREDLEIVVLGFEKRDDGLHAKLHVENLGDSAREIETTEAKINGVPCEGEFACGVRAYSTYITDLFFSNEALENAGIEDFETVEWTIRVSDWVDKIEPYTEVLTCDIDL